MGSPTADNVCEFTNPIDGGNGNRNIYVSGNPDSDTDYVVFSGDLTGLNNLYVRGSSIPGELQLTGSVTASKLHVRDGAELRVNAPGSFNATNIDILLGGSLGGSDTLTGSGKIDVIADGVLAPGDGVGTLSLAGGGELEMSDDSIYEWQVGQPGNTDVLNVTGGTLDLDNFVLEILDANGYVASDTDPLPVFTYDVGTVTINMDDFGNDANNFDTSALGDKGDVWDWTTLALTDDDENGTIYLTGLVGGVSPIDGTMTWALGADGLWDDPNWDAADFIPPGSESDYPDDPRIAVVIDSAWTVTVQNADRQAYSVDISGGGTLAVGAAGNLAVAYGVTVDANGSLAVAGGAVTAARATVSGGVLSVDAGGSLDVNRLALTGGAMNVAGGGAVHANATSISGGALNVGAGAAVSLGELGVSDGEVNLSEDILATNVQITGGTLDTGDKAIVLSGTLQAAGVVVTSDAASFQAIGSGQAGEITVGMTEDGSTTTVTAAAGGGGTLNAPDVSFQSSAGLAVLHFDADKAVVGDLALVSDGGIDLSGAPDVSVRNLSGAGLLVGGVSVRGAVQPGAVSGWMEVYGSVKLEPGAAFQPEVQGPDSLGKLYVDETLDLAEAGDMLAISWLPGDAADSMFGGTYVVADATGGIDGEFDVPGGGNIGAAYIAGVEHDVAWAEGDHGIRVTLYDQLAGDVDLDGEVARGDVLALRGAFGSADADWLGGDLTFDGAVNYLDYIALKRSMGDSVPAGGGITPEPATLLLLVLGACPALLRRRNRAEKRPG